jgi:hypothetical protein
VLFNASGPWHNEDAHNIGVEYVTEVDLNWLIDGRGRLAGDDAPRALVCSFAAMGGSASLASTDRRCIGRSQQHVSLVRAVILDCRQFSQLQSLARAETNKMNSKIGSQPLGKTLR